MTEKVADFQELLEKILVKNCPEIYEKYKISYKKCFGARACYVDGKIFGSLGRFGFALKLPAEEIKNLKK